MRRRGANPPPTIRGSSSDPFKTPHGGFPCPLMFPQEEYLSPLPVQCFLLPPSSTRRSHESTACPSLSCTRFCHRLPASHFGRTSVACSTNHVTKSCVLFTRLLVRTPIPASEHETTPPRAGRLSQRPRWRGFSLTRKSPRKRGLPCGASHPSPHSSG